MILKRNIFQRLLGICATKKPADEGCWTFEAGTVTVDLARAPELAQPDGALRLEGKNLPARILVVKGDGDTWHAFKNRCAHAGRRLDPVPGTGQVQCCSVGKSTYDADGNILSGSARKGIVAFPITEKEGRLKIGV
ncbi:MAG: Rieske 2Fe-2S domain-containing protein [Desulfobacterales bacterium]|nr:Rieske 2Fe-2S domain-containing protein [Desulfobacterales bacterium]